jgi:hypothetical protein
MIKRLLGLGLLAGSTLAWGAPPPPAPANQPVPPPARINVSPVAVPVSNPSGCTSAKSVAVPKTPYRVCLVTIQGWLHFRVFDPVSGEFVGEAPVEHASIFGILASTQMEPLWPDVLAFVGEDGNKLREALRLRAERVLRTNASRPREHVSQEHFVAASLLPVLQAADFYSQAGDLKMVRSLLVERRLKIEQVGLATWNQQFSWVTLQVRLAKFELIHGRPEAAIALYESIAANEQVPMGIRANGTMNHAAMMAETGHPREALALLAKVEPIVMGSKDVVEGSERQFAWIRACALSQLGDRKGTNKAIAVITSAPEELRRASGHLMSTEGLEVRMGYCMGDDAILARALRNTSDYLIDPAAILLQQGRITYVQGTAETNRRLVERIARIGYNPPIRQIPTALVPAMNQWQGSVDFAPPEPVPASVGKKG